MLLQIGPLLRLGSKCYYGWDFYYAWVQMLLQMGPLLHLGPIITLVPSTDPLITTLDLEISSKAHAFHFERNRFLKPVSHMKKRVGPGRRRSLIFLSIFS